MSPTDHFFDDLEADSLVMAHFCARVKKRSGLPPVSIKEVYRNPTIELLAAAISRVNVTAPSVEEDAGSGVSLPVSSGLSSVVSPQTLLTVGAARPEPVRGWRYARCGALQLLTYLGFVFVSALVMTQAYEWTSAASGVASTYYRAAILGGGTFVAWSTLPILTKWALVGRWKAGQFPIWSLAYFRFWLVKVIIQSSPLTAFVGTPIYNLYLRALGAKIGRNAVILSPIFPVCTDLLTIGDGAVIRKDSSLTCYRAHAGLIQTGPVTVGSEAFVGEQTVLDINTTIGDWAQIGHASSMAAGQSVPAGGRRVGTPAENPTTFDYRAVPPCRHSRLRRLVYSLVMLLVLFALTLPLGITIFSALAEWRITSPAAVIQASGSLPFSSATFYREAALLSLMLFFGLMVLRLLFAFTVPRLFNRALKPGRSYPLYGFRYLAHRAVTRLTNVTTFTTLFGDSSYIVHYLYLLGYKVSFDGQTGANFGLNVKHDNPYYVSVGPGTMAADGLSMVNAEYSSTSFRISPVEIGAHSFLGNSIAYPSAGRTGENCLHGSKVMIPVEGDTQEDVGFLGSPSFEIPRNVMRDRKFDDMRRGPDFRRRLSAKNRFNVRSMVWFLLSRWIASFVAILFALGAADLYSRFGILTVIVTALVSLVAGTLYFVLVEWAGAGFRALLPLYCSMYSRDSWKIERFWKLSWYPARFNGTPFRSIMWRLLGVKLGRRVFDDGCIMVEKTMITVGDDCVFNAGSVIQPHSQEDGTFKSDYVSIGARCTLGVGSLVHYGVTMGDDATLGPNAFLMKGSEVEPGTLWAENPAREIHDGGPADGLDVVPEQHPDGVEGNDQPDPVETVAEPVEVESDGSGQVDVVEVTREPVEVESDGSGQVDAKEKVMARPVVGGRVGNTHVDAKASAVGPEPFEAGSMMASDSVGTDGERGAVNRHDDAGSRYWRGVLRSGGTTTVPRWTACSAEHDVTVSGDLMVELGRLADELGVPLSAVFLAAHARVLAALAGEREVVTGYMTGVAWYPLPCRLTMGDGSWRSLILSASGVESEVLAHAAFPIDDLQRELGALGSMFETVFDTTTKAGELTEGIAFRLEIPAVGDLHRLRLHYRIDAYDADAAARIAGYHLAALEQLAADPDADPARHSLLSDDELEFQLEGLSGPARSLPDQRFHRLFEDRVRTHPDSVAAVYRDECWTYAELNAQANRLGRALRAQGLEREGVVAVVTERNLDWMASVLAVFKAGGVYLPVEPHFPADRIAAMLARSECGLALTEAASRTTLDRALHLVPPVDVIDIAVAYGEDHAQGDLDIDVTRNQLAYIYFTSGSTGEPKGAMCEHLGMLNHLFAKVDDLEIGDGEAVAQIAPQCFDISLWQLLSALLVGGQTILIDQDTILDPNRFIDTIVDGEVAVMQVVP
ncbi:MAG: AMP-binding protein, partial [Actinomycetia bacterium]|nr:AMP-binding protein [Actinomycetes bacterium]